MGVRRWVDRANNRTDHVTHVPGGVQLYRRSHRVGRREPKGYGHYDGATQGPLIGSSHGQDPEIGTVGERGERGTPRSPRSFIRWAFGDRTNASGASTSHTYPVGAPYTFSLTVKSVAGQRSTATQSVKLKRPVNRCGNRTRDDAYGRNDEEPG